MSGAQLRLDRGDNILLGGTGYDVVRRNSSGIELREVGGVSASFKSHDDIKKSYFGGKLTIVRGTRLADNVKAILDLPAECFSDAAVATANMRLEYVSVCQHCFDHGYAPKTPAGYARIGRVVAWMRRRASASAAGRPVCSFGLESFGGSTIRDWHWRWRDGGRTINTLIPLDYKKGSETPKLDARSMAIVNSHVRDHWLTASRPPMTIVYEGIVGAISEFNDSLKELDRAKTPKRGEKVSPPSLPLPIPSLSTVSRWIEQNVDDYDAVLARHGKKEAERRFRGVRRAPQPIRPLQIVEVDHTLLDLQALDDSGKPCRPWLTVAICGTTRMIYGFHLGFEAPSWTTVMSCLRMGALPKDELIVRQKELNAEVLSEWPVFGLPEILVVDNGKDFQSNSLKAAAGQLGFELRYTPKRRPHLKGKIERFFGEVARNFLAYLPGRTFANIQQKGDYDAQAHAAMTLDEVRNTFLIWALDYHHNKPHRGLMLRTPLQKWRELDGYGVRMPPKADDLTSFLGLVFDRSIRNKGIEYLGLLYQSRELQLLRRGPSKSERKWTIKADPLDLSQISVLDEKGQTWLKVPSEDPALTDGLTIADYKKVLEEAKVQVSIGQKVNVADLLNARKRLIEIGVAKGVRRFSSPVEIEVDWFRANVDAPIVRVADKRGRSAVDPLASRRAADRELKTIEEQGKPEKDGLGSDGVLLAPPLSKTRLGKVVAPPLQDDEAVAGGLPLDGEAAGDRKRKKPKIDYDDPETWGEI